MTKTHINPKKEIILQPVVLYLNNLLKLEFNLKASLTEEQLEISYIYKDYEYSSIQELSQDTQRNLITSLTIKVMLISTQNAKFDIEIKNSGSSIIKTTNIYDRTIIYLMEICRIELIKHQTLFSRIPISIYIAPILVIGLFAIQIFWLPREFLKPIESYPIIAIMIVATMAAILFKIIPEYIKYRHTKSFIYLIDKKDKPSFLRKNKDPILVGLISAIASGFIGVIVGILFRK